MDGIECSKVIRGRVQMLLDDGVEESAVIYGLIRAASYLVCGDDRAELVSLVERLSRECLESRERVVAQRN